MKKGIATLLILCMVFALCACGETALTENPTNGASPTAPASDEVYVIRVANTNNEDSYSGDVTHYLFDTIAEKSGGRIQIEYYWSGSLGDKTTCVEAIRTHTLGAVEIATTDLAAYQSSWSAFALPFLFGDAKDAELACYTDKEFYDYLDSTLADTGFKLLSFHTTGYRNPLNTIREVRSPKDASGIRIRCLGNAYIAKAFEYMGFAPVSLGWSEVYSGMQQGTIDGAEQSAALLCDNQLYDYGKYLTLLDAVAVCGMFVMDREMYDKMPADLQAIIDETCVETMKMAWASFGDIEAQATQTLIDNGVTITELTAEEKVAFTDRISGIKGEMFAETPATEELYNHIQDTLARLGY